MKADSPLDYAAFQLSPRRTRCELFVSCRGETEKLASGLLKPFVTHLRAAEERVSRASGQLIKLEVPEGRNGAPWFTKGTLERFVRFISTPEVLELANTVDAEMTQLEAARSFQLNLYSKLGTSEQASISGSDTRSLSLAGSKPGQTDAAEASKRELLRAIDVRLMALQQELSVAFARAASAGFAIENIAHLKAFAEHFGASRLNETCSKFMSLCQKRQDLCPWRDEAEIPSSGSDMSIDNETEGEADNTVSSNGHAKKSHGYGSNTKGEATHIGSGNHVSVSTGNRLLDDQKNNTPSFSRVQSTESICSSSGGTGILSNWQGCSKGNNLAEAQSNLARHSSSTGSESDIESSNCDKQNSEPAQKGPPTRSLSVQERIHLFESKQKEQRDSSEGIKKLVKCENKRLSTETGNSSAVSEKSVLRRWSGAGGDTSTDLSGSQQTKNANYKETAKLCNRTNNEVRGTASENSMQTSTAEEQNEAGFHFRRDQREWSASSESETSTDNRILKSVSNAVCEEQESVKCLQSKSICAKDTWRSFEELRNNLPFRAALQGSETPDPLCVKQSGVATQALVTADSNLDAKVIMHSKEAEGAWLNAKTPGIYREPVETETVKIREDESTSKLKQSKGNRELNEELREKANQLEALFAVHKLRNQGLKTTQGEPTATMKSGRSIGEDLSNMQTEESKKPGSVMPREKQASAILQRNNGGESLGRSWGNGVDFDVNALTQIAGHSDLKDFGKAWNSNEEGNSRAPRGKFYERYREKRDAKLREESITKRRQKETKLKALQETLERSKVELEALKAAKAIVEHQDPMYQARFRAEKFRSFNDRISKLREQTEAHASDEEEAFDDVQDRKANHHPQKDISKLPARKVPVSKLAQSTTPRTSTALPSPSPRTSNALKTTSGRRRGSENPLSQSVPNFSELRKENTKPSSSRIGGDKVGLGSRGQSKPCNRPRKSATSTNENKDQSLASNGPVLAPLKVSKETCEPAVYGKAARRSGGAASEAKPFLRKGNGIGPGAGPGMAKLKASRSSENMKSNENETEPIPLQEDETADDEMGNELSLDGKNCDVEYNEPRRSSATENFETPEDSDDSQNEFNAEKEMNMESSERLHDAPSEFETLSRDEVKVASANSDLMAGASASYQLRTSGALQHFNHNNVAIDSPMQSPASWSSSHIHHSLSQVLETSDVDACVDSPMGSPASWNSHLLSQFEASDTDVGRTRKKWGIAQKPLTTVSHKESPKGLKRLLKFGRKSRGSETVNTDWVSASLASEGDDDTEDDLLRKSRMGFASGYPSYSNSYEYGNALGGSVESEAFGDQSTVNSLHGSMPPPPAQFKIREDHLSAGSSLKASRSFFSLPTFRSKGSESKTR